MSDLINRQDAIEALEGVDWYHINETTGKMVHGSTSDMESWYKVDDVRKAIEQLPSAQQTVNQWISTCDYLPEYSKKVIVRFYNGQIEICSMRRLNEQNNYWLCDWSDYARAKIVDDLDWWMPIPEWSDD